MSQPCRITKPDAQEIPGEISALIAAVQELPIEQRSRLEPILEKVVESTKRRRRILTLVQDALGQLRVDMKYLVFDLEATRRERDHYRRQAEGG
jgi:hypothetical protein